MHISGSQERSNNMKPGRPIPPGPLGSKSASLLSLTPSQHSAFNTVGPSNRTPAKVMQPCNGIQSIQSYRLFCAVALL